MLEIKNEKRELFWEIFSKQNRLLIDEFQKYMDKFAVNFNLYKDGNFIERSLPFDVIPRIIDSKEFDKIDKGLSQRIKALNLFLEDLYTQKKIIKDKVIPEEFIFQAKGYLKELNGFSPNKKIRTHINGIDLVKDTITNDWVILEDNLRVPSGASYPLSIRDTYRKIYSDFFEELKIKPIKGYPQILENAMDYVSCGGINVVLTPGRFNSAYYEHAYLAKKIGAQLVRNDELIVKNKILYFKNYDGKLIKVGAVYRRLDDEFLDPKFFNPESLIGVSGIMEAYLAGNVAIMNAPGNGVADDKGIYYFVPEMIKYYLGEEPILNNAPTYLPYFEKDRKYIFENIHKLVIKDVAEAGGYGVMFGHTMTNIQINDLKTIIASNPRRFIAQELIEFYDEECYINNEIVPRKADFRAYVVMADEPKVWQCGLTRYAMEAGNYLVNSSQGGGFKDTWVMEA
ncbi:circularly permuted type 2 ATP-grasp protein [Aliarcobacter butzleri]|uniref:circularly permuted type 2 ATP-grasp protein n=1 Tax=Aliarcobacter butzleri TaxID=28197 RepID=UPI00125EB0D0|nr:circularly permuted type 2 ATP-grasp protein [Aliarcobacter butzleri]MCT7551147.1 circularly permuted type 2 ATP-grasp protein [Aliarcobacter butzleri]MCT7560110.1 circularly permuted type 2 ATP-grasp protein [Aliarcobacter butzleri]MCT7595372.1 circularly permuted type 2 ATP-grasp protein [Aliarcobacter butzleri]MCT7600000.1 circularly permuted type 2 ATP-grasp protein [Aliarcobacter butzleri]MCT7644236.1 circularly permuted type 2 ATP-grasp protein [Aliarcobacter butzleri]